MNKIKHAFSAVRAGEELKANTLSYIRSRRRLRPALLLARTLAPIAACLALMVFGGWCFLMPTAHISIDINPSLELGINRFDRVVSVRGRNADGEALAQSLELTFADYDSAVERILESEAVEALLGAEGELSITVVGENPDQSQRILSCMEHHTAGRENTGCYSARHEEVEHAHHLGLSYGKYRAYLELAALDPSVTPEEAARMSMKEIRERIRALSSGQTEETTAPPEEGTEPTQQTGGHHGGQGGKHG